MIRGCSVSIAEHANDLQTSAVIGIEACAIPWTRVLQRPCPRELTALPLGFSLEYIPMYCFLEGSSLELLCKGHLMEEVCFAVKAPGAADLSEELLVQAL